MLYLEEIRLALILLAVVLAYTLLLQPRLRTIKQKLLERFLNTQSLSLKMQDLILKHVLKNDAMNKELVNEITCKAYLRNLQKKHAAYLSDTYYKSLKKQHVIFFYLKVSRMLDKQEQRLLKVKQDLLLLEEFPKGEARKAAVN